jgi:adenylate kinase
VNILLIGASGSGKGTQAQKLVEKYGFCHLSMGDVLKEQVKLGTEEGKLIDSYQKNGDLVPLDVVLRSLDNKIASETNANGFLLDGFPRNMAQVEALKLPIALVLNFNNDLDKIKDRLVNRRVCKDCNSNSHVSLLVDGKCRVCGGEVYQRTDDNEASIDKRLNFYRNEVLPVVAHYKANGYNVVDIDGDQSIEGVTKQIEMAIESLKEN